MRELLRLVPFVILWGCDSTPRPVEPEPAPPGLPEATTLCYRAMSRISVPDVGVLGSSGLLVRRTIDPATSRIVEEVVEFDAPQEQPPREYVLDATVDGERFTFELEGGRGEGRLVGEPWAWTGWSSETTLADGSRVVSEDEASGRDIRFRQQVFDPTGAPVVVAEGLLNRISCREFETLRPLALSGQLISDMQTP